MIRVLAVEDNLGDQCLLREAIMETGVDCSVIFAASAEASLKSIYIDNPDLIFMDINMPGLAGDDFVALFQSGPYASQAKKVVFLTGADLSEDKVDPLSQRVLVKNMNYPLLKKPVNVKEIKRILKGIVREGRLYGL